MPVENKLPTKLVILDLNYTLCPEPEYGLALKKAGQAFIHVAQRYQLLPADFNEGLFLKAYYADVQQAHRALNQDDWDNRVFDASSMPTAFALLGNDKTLFARARQAAMNARNGYTAEQAEKNIYPAVKETIAALRAQGIQVVVATDTCRSGAEAKIKAMGLDGEIDGLYCGDSHPEALYLGERLTQTSVHPFSPGSYKPDPAIIGHILLDYAKQKALVPAELAWEDIFALNDNRLVDPHYAVNDYVRKKLVVKESAYKPLFSALLTQTMGFGDDYRDHLMYNNAGITCVKAEYGERAKTRDKADAEASDILHRTSGWDASRLSLLQYAKIDGEEVQLKINHLAEKLRKVDYTVKEQFSELLDIVILSQDQIKQKGAAQGRVGATL